MRVGLSKGSFFTIYLILLAAFFNHKTLSQPVSNLWSFWDQSDESNLEQINHQAWSDTLFKYLDTSHPSGVNRFSYASVDAAGYEKLKTYISSLAGVDPRTLNRDEQFAYWVNLYNALTVELVLRKYPVSSITKIKKGFFSFGPWDMDMIEIADQTLTLNDIEHRILRPIWQDNRIHFAVNCASIGCPSLRVEPFISNQLDEQLNEAAQDYLAHPRGINVENGRLILSKIFEWYQSDFGQNEDQMLETILLYLPASTAEQLEGYEGKIKYEYDWRLNEP